MSWLYCAPKSSTKMVSCACFSMNSPSMNSKCPNWGICLQHGLGDRDAQYQPDPTLHEVQWNLNQCSFKSIQNSPCQIVATGHDDHSDHSPSDHCGKFSVARDSLLHSDAGNECNEHTLHTVNHEGEWSPLCIAANQIGNTGSQSTGNCGNPGTEQKGCKGDHHVAETDIPLDGSGNPYNQGKDHHHCSKHCHECYSERSHFFRCR